MANPQTWKDPNTGEEYELVPDTAPVQKTWKDPKTGEEYELVPDTPKSPTISEGLAAGYRVAKDEIPYVQSRTKEGAYMDLARKMGKNLVTDYFSPKALIPGRDMFGVDSYDYETLFNDAKKAGLVNDNDRASFEKNLLSRSGAREEDLATTAQAPISGFIGGIGSLVNDPLNVGAGIALGPISKGMGLAKGMFTEGLANAGTELAQLPFTNEAIKALGEGLSPEEMAARVAMAGGFGAGLHGLFRSLGIGDRVEAEPTVRTEETPSVEVAAPAATREWTDEEMLGITKMVEEGGTVDDIAKVYPLTQEQRDALGWYVEANKKGQDQKIIFEGGDKPAEEDVPFEAPDFLNQPVKGPFKETPAFLNESAAPRTVKDLPKPAKGKKAVSIENSAKKTSASAPGAVKEPETAPIRVPVNKAVDHINDITRDWKAAPEFSVAGRLEDLPDNVRRDIIEDGAEDAIGVTVDGKVYILAHNIKDADELSAVTFHEALGHVGLERMFRQRLDAVLTQMYNTNEMVRNSADGWLAKNSTQAGNPIAHAVEEILAETSEGGKIEARILDKVRAFLKQYARRIPGLKNLKYTDKEVYAILSMAHQKVTDGGRSVGRTGNRYMRMFNASNDNPKLIRQQRPKVLADNIDRDTTNAYPENTFNTSPLSEREAWDAADLLADEFGLTPEQVKQQMGKDFPERWAKSSEEIRYSKPDEKAGRTRGLRIDKNIGKNQDFNSKFIRELEKDLPEKYRQSWEETEELASKIGMNVKKMEELRKGPKAEEIEAGRMFTIGKLNLIHDLQKKMDEGTITPREMDQFAIHLRQFVGMFEIMDEVMSTAGRNLNILKKMTVNNKAAVNNVRYALEQAEKNGLRDVESMKQISKALDELKKNPKINRHGYSKLATHVFDVLNIPRTIMSSFDLSAPLRQGLSLVHRKEWWGAFFNMFKYSVSPKAYKEMLAEIQSRPTFKAMEDAKLFIADIDNELNSREEAFMSKFASRLPGIKLSERAYNGFLNKLRADTFDTIYQKSIAAGLNLEKGSKELKDIASFINNATGRGSIKHFDESMPILSAIFFSPRLIASRIQMLNPAYYAQLSPVVRKEALKSAMSLGVIAMTIGALAQTAGADVESDPRSSDFMKIKTGDTRYDILGGFGQYITLGARLVTNEEKTMSGVIKKYGSKFGEKTRLDVIEKFFENKFSPVASFVADYFRGKNAVGKEFNMSEAVTTRVIPLYLQDAYDVMKDRDFATGALMAVPGIFGVGTQTYSDERGGAEVKDRSTDDPALQEIQRLGGDKDIVSTGSRDDAKSLGIEKLDDEQLKTYRDYSAQLISAATKEAMATEEWKQASDEERVKWVKQIGKEMRLIAREDLFGSSDEEEQPWDEYNDEE